MANLSFDVESYLCTCYYCPKDRLPCDRFCDDLGAGVCEVLVRKSGAIVQCDTCKRFVVRSKVAGVDR